MVFLRRKLGSKMGNEPVVMEGQWFQSKKEGRRYAELLLLLRVGEIKDLELQPIFVVQSAYIDAQGEKHRKITYKADFRYLDVQTGKTIVEDVKGFKTQVYRLKKKLLLKQLPKGCVFREI